MIRRQRFTVPVVVVLSIAVGAFWLRAQVAGSKEGPVAGTLIDSVSGQPVVSAEVVLGPRVRPLVGPQRQTGTASFASTASRSANTDCKLPSRAMHA